MIVDHRTYTLFPGTMGAYLTFYEEVGYAIQSKYLGKPMAFFTSMDIGELNQVVHLWGYESLGDRSEKRTKLSADADWKSYLAQQMPRIMRMENKILTQVPFAPLALK